MARSTRSPRSRRTVTPVAVRARRLASRPTGWSDAAGRAAPALADRRAVGDADRRGVPLRRPGAAPLRPDDPPLRSRATFRGGAGEGAASLAGGDAKRVRV